MLIKILALHASGHGVHTDYGHRIIDAAKIDEIRDDPHVVALDDEGNELPKKEGKTQYEPEAVRLIRYVEAAGGNTIAYTVRGTITEWRDRLNKKRFTQVKSLDQPDPAPAPEPAGDE